MLHLIFILMLDTSASDEGFYFYSERLNLPTVTEKYLESIGPSYKPKMVDGTLEPKHLPDFKKNRQTLLGEDSNRDGIRDDIEIYINRTVMSKTYRIIYKNYYLAYAKFFKLSKSLTNSEVRKLLDFQDGILQCDRYLIGKNFIYPEESKKNYIEIGRLIVNTPERSSAVREGMLRSKASGPTIFNADDAFAYCPEEIKKQFPKVLK